MHGRSVGGALTVGVAVAVALASCAGPVAVTGPASPSPDPVQTVQAVTGPIESTLVLPAVTQASPEVTITAREAGRYAMNGGHLSVTDASGATSSVTLPSGVVLDGVTVGPSSVVPVNHPVARAHVSGFALVATLAPASLYRLYETPRSAQGQIDEGPGPFACSLGDPVPHPGSGSEEGATLTCIVPRAVQVFGGLTGVVSVVTGAEDEAVLLPLEAVAGDATAGTVLVLAPGRQPEERRVGLGISDGSRIAVTSGLRAGETVRIPGPDLGARS